jgi:hypothetical protein
VCVDWLKFLIQATQHHHDRTIDLDFDLQLHRDLIKSACTTLAWLSSTVATNSPKWSRLPMIHPLPTRPVWHNNNSNNNNSSSIVVLALGGSIIKSQAASTPYFGVVVTHAVAT